jgi:hypothetical protein
MLGLIDFFFFVSAKVVEVIRSEDVSLVKIIGQPWQHKIGSLDKTKMRKSR